MTQAWLCIALCGFLASASARDVPPGVALRGILRVDGRESALFELSGVRKPEEECTLSAGTRNGRLEVLEIDSSNGKIKLRRSGLEEELSLDSAKPDTAPATAASAPNPTHDLEKPASIWLQKTRLTQVLAAYEQLTGRTVLRPTSLPPLRFDYRSSSNATLSMVTTAITRILATQGIALRPEGAKFAVVSRSKTPDPISDQFRDVAARIVPTGKSNLAASRPAGVPDQILPAGAIAFFGADYLQVLSVFGELTGRTIVLASLPSGEIWITTQSPLTTAEASFAVAGVLAMNDVCLRDAGEKFLLAFPVGQSNRVASLMVHPPARLTLATQSTVQPEAFRSFSRLRDLVRFYAQLAGHIVEMDDSIDTRVPMLGTSFPLSAPEALEYLDWSLGLSGLTIDHSDNGKPWKLTHLPAP
jgi:hypothetical protein